MTFFRSNNFFKIHLLSFDFRFPCTWWKMKQYLLISSSICRRTSQLNDVSFILISWDDSNRKSVILVRVLQRNRTNRMCVAGGGGGEGEILRNWLTRLWRPGESKIWWRRPTGWTQGRGAVPVQRLAEFLLACRGGQPLFYSGLQMIGWGLPTLGNVICFTRSPLI